MEKSQRMEWFRIKQLEKSAFCIGVESKIVADESTHPLHGNDVLSSAFLKIFVIGRVW